MHVDIHMIDNEGITKCQKDSATLESNIETELNKYPSILEDLLIIGRQVKTSSGGRIDLLGMDKEGNLAIIEIKKGSPDRKVVAQILEYAVWTAGIQENTINEIAKENKIDLRKEFKNLYPNNPLDSFNQNQRLYIVAEEIDENVKQVCKYLVGHGIDIKYVRLSFFKHGEKKLVFTDSVVDENSELDDTMTKKQTWADKLKWTTPENLHLVEDLIKHIKEELQYTGNPQSVRYYFKIELKAYAVIQIRKSKSYIQFRISEKFKDEEYGEDENIKDSKSSFFYGSDKRKIQISKKNFDLIIKCLKHSYKVTKEKVTKELSE